MESTRISIDDCRGVCPVDWVSCGVEWLWTHDEKVNCFGGEVHLVVVCGRGCPFCCGAWAVPCPHQARQRGLSTSCRKCRGWKGLLPLPGMVVEITIGMSNKRTGYTYICMYECALGAWTCRFVVKRGLSQGLLGPGLLVIPWLPGVVYRGSFENALFVFIKPANCCVERAKTTIHTSYFSNDVLSKKEHSYFRYTTKVHPYIPFWGVSLRYNFRSRSELPIFNVKNPALSENHIPDTMILKT